ncbi:WD repeat-containing protein 46 [Eublepharis macularius]|uniref:WD repeat-containing protein 46 n=1 Tax=Eublepharis macularius TaxID=481883 RepID=A0AA97J808_EUBMA|nr:WD repeat-containing protein 46 [Eublepharis macularius]
MVGGLGEKKKRPQRYWEGEEVRKPEPEQVGPPDSKKPYQDGGHLGKKLEPGRRDQISGKKRPQQYWEGEEVSKPEHKQVDLLDSKKPCQPGVHVGKKSKPGGRDQISGKVDPFPGPAVISDEWVQKFRRGTKPKEKGKVSNKQLRHKLALQEEKAEAAAKQAARMDLLLLEEPGFLEGDEGEDTCTITQADIADAVDLAAGAKRFELRLAQFGPYRLSYTRNGRHLLLGGRRGHVAALDWHTKALLCEINVMETVTDLAWLHTETMFAVAQRKWLYVYDNQGVELSCLKRFHGVQRMEFLPYHFLLATASETGFLQYLDVSVGKEVATICTKGGRLGVMTQNPSNAIVHLGHSNGTVTLWSPNVKEPLVRMLCHRGAVRALAVDGSGSYMATSGLDRKLHIYDLRTYQRLHSLLLPIGAGHLDFSQRGLLGAACQEVVQVYKDISVCPSKKPYLCHALPRAAQGLRFCPFEDVLGVGHEEGFESLLVPGAGEPNFDALESNPFRSRKQRQEWEVKALLEKIPSELISLDPGQLGTVDTISLEQQRQERVARLGYDPEAKGKFSPRRRMKGRDSAGSRLKRKQKVAAEEQRAAIRKSLAEKGQVQEPESPPEAFPASRRSALDRFRK